MFDKFVETFRAVIGIEWSPSDDLAKECRAFLSEIDLECDDERIGRSLIEAVNNKLDCNHASFRSVIDTAFKTKVILDYHKKDLISRYLNSSDYDGFNSLLEEIGEQNNLRLRNSFNPVSLEQTLEALRAMVNSDKRCEEVLDSIFARFVFNSYPIDQSRRVFSSSEVSTLSHSEFVKTLYPDEKRKFGLVVLQTSTVSNRDDYQQTCNDACMAIDEAYDQLSNHSCLCIVIPQSPSSNNEDFQWVMYSDLVLYAEKSRLEKLRHMYFRKKQIEEATSNYISELDLEKASFDDAAYGFVFKDCFVVDCQSDSSCHLLVVLEKNFRDERIIPCPACYSSNVQGNSYPILNVRSWECSNPMCPDKSKYNRGKRYQFASLQRQEHIGIKEDQIPPDSISKWHLDRVSVDSIEDIYEMVIRHYSYYGDEIGLISCTPEKLYGRYAKPIDYPKADDDPLTRFKEGPYFARYNYDHRVSEPEYEIAQLGRASIVHAESLGYLSTLPSESIDGAVTSPPYYNAKAYSTWPNIYCYLYDMRNIAREVFRVLKPGGVFLYNIFDYFDNENNIVLSAMGNKRMILGPYTIDLFRRIGFELYGNIVWSKGEIQGNRSFNQGNLSPFYQAPLNCWEHVFVFSKGTPRPAFQSLRSTTVSFSPVIKMVRGKNTFGHEAPFPEDIPNLLIEKMTEGDVVLDPFAGSFTTCVAAEQAGINSIGIEQNEGYCELGCQRLQCLHANPKLFK